ncbi:MAG: ABC transporter permease, partial [Chloroflexota bacterium]
MTTINELVEPVDPTEDQTKVESGLRETLKGVLRTTSGKVGIFLLVFHLLMALFAPVLVPYDPLEIPDSSLGLKLAPPSAEHWLGNDRVGRDVLSRTMMGGRISLLVTISAIIIAISWSAIGGMFLGLVGGRIDEIVMRVVDAVQAIPYLLFLLLIISIVGTEVWVLILTLGFFSGISPLRIFRNATLDFVARDFIVAARARGESLWTILRRELLPNILDIVLVEGAMRWSWMLLSFSSLSFLGFGVAPPTPDWGLMISDSRGVMQLAPWWTFSPIVALSSLIMAINLTAEALAKATGLDRAQGAPV